MVSRDIFSRQFYVDSFLHAKLGDEFENSYRVIVDKSE